MNNVFLICHPTLSKITPSDPHPVLKLNLLFSPFYFRYFRTPYPSSLRANMKFLKLLKELYLLSLFDQQHF